MSRRLGCGMVNGDKETLLPRNINSISINNPLEPQASRAVQQRPSALFSSNLSVLNSHPMKRTPPKVAERLDRGYRIGLALFLYHVMLL